MAKIIDADDITIENYFNYPELRIPPFQREFVWNAEEAEEFWEDLISEHTHFIGSIILQSDHYNEEDRTGYLDIVDGQQRTISLVILFSVLARKFKEMAAIGRDDFYKNAEQHAFEINRLISYRDEVDLTKVVGYKLRLPDEGNNEVFIDALAAGEVALGARAEYKIFHSAFNKYQELFDTRLVEFKNDEDKIRELIKIKNKILNVRIIRILVPTDEDAYSIFESVNARGEDLGVADLLKNYLFSKLEDKKYVEEKWIEIKRILSEISRKGFDFTSFLRYYWVSVHAHLSKKALYRAIKKKVEGKDEESKSHPLSAAQLIREISDYAETINKIFGSGLDDWKSFFPGGRREQRRAHEWFSYKRNLSFFQKSLQYLPIYSVLIGRIENLPIENKCFIDLLLSIEKINFIYSYVLKKQTNRIDKILSEIARNINRKMIEIENGKSKLEEIQSVVLSGSSDIKKILRENIDEKEVRDFVANLRYTNKADKALIYFILINQEYSEGGYGRVLVEDDLTLEHIYPQRASKNSVDGWTVADFDYDKLGHGIGNITFLPESGPLANGSANNGTYLENRDGFYLKSYTINNYFNNIEKWDEKEIKKRLKHIQDFVWDRWGKN